MHSRADSTVQSQQSRTNSHFISNTLGEEKRCKSAVQEACNAVAWVHTTAGFPLFSTHPFVKATLEGLQRTLAKPIVKQEPGTVEMLNANIQDARKSGQLSDLRLAMACLMDFAGFLHSEELINLRPYDITIDAEMMSMKILHSNTDQLWQGDIVAVARTGSSTYPACWRTTWQEQVQWPVIKSFYSGLVRVPNMVRC